MCDFSLSNVELCLSRNGITEPVYVFLNLQDAQGSLSNMIIETFLRHFEAQNRIRVTFDLAHYRGYISEMGGMYDQVIGEFVLTDDVFWRAVLDEIKTGSLSTFLNTLRGA